MDYRADKLISLINNNSNIFEYEKIDEPVICCFGNILYSVLSEIKYSNDYGRTWTVISAPLFSAMHITQNYIVYGFIKNGSTTDIYKSTDFTTFTKINTTNLGNIGTVTPYGMDSNSNVFMFCESNSSLSPEVTYARVFATTDYGVEFKEVFRANTGFGDIDKIGHFHNVTYLGGHDSYNEPQTWILTSGDHNNNIKWWFSKDNGDTWIETEGLTDQKYRTVNMNRLADNTLIWSADAVPCNLSGIYKCKLDDVINTTELIQSLPLTSWGCVTKGYGVCVTVREGDSKLGNVQIYATKDNGNSWNLEKQIPIRNHPVNHDQPGFHNIVGPDGEGSYYIYGTALRNVTGIKIKLKNNNLI